MKRREDLRRRFVHQWVEKAEQDLGAAQHLLAQRAPYPNVIAFHAQQAAEKLIQAYLTFHQAEFPKTHDLGRLLVLVKRVD
jgi:HEPN domain-containing protein